MKQEKYKNKYRISSARNHKWDYGWDSAYFITICIKNQTHYFGEIIDAKINLSSVGIIADIMWHDIKNHAKNIVLDEFVVMPNHIHGILILDGNNKYNDDGDNGGINSAINVQTRHALSLVSSQSQKSPSPPLSQGQKRFRNQGKNTVSSIIGSYKSAVTKHSNRLGFEFVWQTRFHDNIIRDAESFHRIRNYIINNPKKWEQDKFNK